MTYPTDIIDRELHIGDHVVFCNRIYTVLSYGKIRSTQGSTGRADVRIILDEPSPTTKPVVKLSKDLCVLPQSHYWTWKLNNA